MDADTTKSALLVNDYGAQLSCHLLNQAASHRGYVFSMHRAVPPIDPSAFLVPDAWGLPQTREEQENEAVNTALVLNAGSVVAAHEKRMAQTEESARVALEMMGQICEKKKREVQRLTSEKKVQSFDSGALSRVKSKRDEDSVRHNHALSFEEKFAQLQSSFEDQKRSFEEQKRSLEEQQHSIDALQRSVSRLERKECALTLGNFWISFWESTSLLSTINSQRPTAPYNSVGHLLAGLSDTSLQHQVDTWLATESYFFTAVHMNQIDTLIRPNRNDAAHFFERNAVTWYIGVQSNPILFELYNRYYHVDWNDDYRKLHESSSSRTPRAEPPPLVKPQPQAKPPPLVKPQPQAKPPPQQQQQGMNRNQKRAQQRRQKKSGGN